MRKTIYSREHRVLVELLRQLRENAGLTQAELAERLDRPQSFVSKYENGDRRLDLVELRHIGLELGIRLQTLVKRFESALAGSR